jgi:chromate reductase
MNILAISGSLRQKSYNTALLCAAKNIAPESMRITNYESLVTIPPFDCESNDNNLPQSIIDFRSRVAAADGIIISTPEYAYGVSGVLKNALDWLVASGELVLKPVVAMSVSTSELGGMRAHSSLVTTLSAMNAKVIVEASLNVPFAKNKFNQKCELVDTLTGDVLLNALSIFEKAIRFDQ